MVATARGEPLGGGGHRAGQLAHLPEELGAGDPGHGDGLLGLGLAGGDAALGVGQPLALPPRGHGVVPGSAQYSGRAARLAVRWPGGFSQPGNLHVAVLVCSVMMLSRALGGSYTSLYHFISLRNEIMK